MKNGYQALALAAPVAFLRLKGTEVPLRLSKVLSVALTHTVPRKVDWNRQFQRRPWRLVI